MGLTMQMFPADVPFYRQYIMGRKSTIEADISYHAKSARTNIPGAPLIE